MRTLPKHLRPRYRYLGVTIETWPDATVERETFGSALTAAVRWLFGDAGVASAEPRVVRFSHDTGAGQAVVRTRRDAVDTTRAGLAALTQVEAEPIAVCVRGISGTVRACEEKYLHGRQLPIGESTVTFEGTSYPATVRGACVDVHLEDAFAGVMDLDLT